MADKLYFEFMVALFSEKHLSDQELCFVASFFWEHFRPEYKDRLYKKAKNVNKKISPFWLFAQKVNKCLFYKNLSYFDFIWPEISSEAKKVWASCISNNTWIQF